MKKTILLACLGILLVSGCGQQALDSKPTNQTIPNKQNSNDINVVDEDKILDNVKQQLINYSNYTPQAGQIDKVVISDEKNLYYYGADNKRYTFPNYDVFKSWFGDYDLKTMKVESKETLYKTSLGGNVTLRPGSLMQTETDPHIYLVISNGRIKAIDKDLLTEIYGSDWEKSVYTLPNFYFTHYEVMAPITSLKDFPNIIPNFTIDRDKGLK